VVSLGCSCCTSLWWLNHLRRGSYGQPTDPPTVWVRVSGNTAARPALRRRVSAPPRGL
jgi:hypothetical protein